MPQRDLPHASHRPYSFLQARCSNKPAVLVLACGLVLSLFTAPAHAQKVALADRASYQLALAASQEGMHEVAALKYEKLLKEKDLNKQEAAQLSERLVDALIRAGLPEKALVALTLFEVPEASFWKAQAYLQQHKFRDAESELKTYLKAAARYASQAHLALGKAIIGQGRENAGRKELKDVLNDPYGVLAEVAYDLSNESEAMSGRADIVLRRLGPERGTNESEFVRACALLEEGEGKQAEIVLRRFLDAGQPLPLRLHDASFVRLAEAYAMQGRTIIAGKRLRAFIDRGTPSDYLEQAFAMFRALVPDEDDDTVLKYLLAWAADPTPPERQALALYHTGQWLLEHGRGEEAIGFFESFRVLHPNHARQGDALRSLMALYGAARADDRVVDLWRSHYGNAGPDIVDYLLGMVRFARSEYPGAGDHFLRSAAETTDTLLLRLAIYNAGMSAVLGKNEEKFRYCLTQLQQPVAVPPGGLPLQPSSQAVAEDQAPKLLVERALGLAAKRDPNADKALEEFLQAYPSHPRAVEAHVAQAELAMLDLPARTKAAGAALDAAEQIPALEDKWRERLAYIRVWWHEAAGNLEGVTASGASFLSQWTESDWRDEVRMKVAQAYYRREEYARAVAEFETLAEEHADSPYADVAIFFAGKAAMAQLTPAGLERAIGLWAELVARESPLASEARRQQAVAKRRQGKEDEAMSVIDALLSSKPAPEGDARFDLIMEKGELLVLLARKDPKNLDDAAAVFRSVVEDKNATRAWRQRAGILLAQCHQQAGRRSAALEACFDVLEGGLSPHAAMQLSLQDRVWIFRAGFMAIELLEAQKQWEAAARLADRLAKIGGERSDEAAQRAERLRLEHLIWEK
ncbi:outer membrane lipoprotein YfiO [Roseimicrobium gellanilyticum]|uniref:Outer membrane lipoprotein YfiO n=1 Tax=Roseimicrobium gellanilyticum TaxID=748857 RepID=A0A366HEH5_9BACT|nr:outer membrane protein assembly factor BamD [Roseimicrobium gellanilyticum]RBP40329.1 outer membrane lipoprotein YfiO [Roseimicrobium gellanilyticum]